MKSRGHRFVELDILRGLALCGMIFYHTLFIGAYWYGLPGTPLSPEWRSFARTMASTFLLLVGVSVYLKYSRLQQKGESGANIVRSFAQRIGLLAAAAALVSIGSYAFLPSEWIMFGILHHITVATVTALLTVKYVPLDKRLWLAVATFGAGVWIRSYTASFPWLIWIGLTPINFRTLDYFPVLPWITASILGTWLGERWYRGGERQFLIWPFFSRFSRGWVARPLIWMGQHSLIIYLLHAPLIVLFFELWT